MWNLDLSLLAAHLPGGRLPALAIETGTCRGAGTRALAARFERVITIELDSRLHEEARNRFASCGFAHVRCVRGDSAAELPRILKLIGDDPVFFFLDAHWSGDRTVDWSRAAWKGYDVDTAHRGPSGRTPSGPKQCPLLEELRAIRDGCRGWAAILIDDLKNIPPSGPGMKDLEFPGEDWSHLTRGLLLDSVGDRLESVRELECPPRLFMTLRASSASQA